MAWLLWVAISIDVSALLPQFYYLNFFITDSVCFVVSELGTLSVSELPHSVLSKLRHPMKGRANLGQTPEAVTITLHGHTKPVNTVQWSRSHGGYFM